MIVKKLKMSNSISWILLIFIFGFIGCGTHEQKEIKRLVKELQHESTEISSRVEETLVKIGKDTVPTLIQALQDKNASSRVEETLVKIGKDAVPALIPALQDRNQLVRRRTARVLSRIGEDAVPALVQLLQDKDRNIRRDATWALGRIGKRSEDVVPALIQALQDEDEIVRRAVTFALAETDIFYPIDNETRKINPAISIFSKSLTSKFLFSFIFDKTILV